LFTIAEVERTDWLGCRNEHLRNLGLSVKAVQADLPNRLEVLHFHGVVLSVKVKAKSADCMARLCMV
jgi:hypothetical protein